MRVTLDGQELFGLESAEIKQGGFSRDSVERAVPGLDGVLSVDLGGRGRQIKQTGVLRARSRSQMKEKTDAILSCIDGGTHTLVTGTGEEFGDLRVDTFKVMRERASGGDFVVDYEIVYTQLVV